MPELAWKWQPRCIHPSPFHRDVGGSSSLDGGMGEGETWGGTQGKGGLSSASPKWTTMFIVVRFLYFFMSSIQLTAPLPDTSVTKHIGMERSKCWCRRDCNVWEASQLCPGEGMCHKTRAMMFVVVRFLYSRSFHPRPPPFPMPVQPTMPRLFIDNENWLSTAWDLTTAEYDWPSMSSAHHRYIPPTRHQVMPVTFKTMATPSTRMLTEGPKPMWRKIWSQPQIWQDRGTDLSLTCHETWRCNDPSANMLKDVRPMLACWKMWKLNTGVETQKISTTQRKTQQQGIAPHDTASASGKGGLASELPKAAWVSLETVKTSKTQRHPGTCKSKST